jgi:CubicO group peptidase (beta-lactamase class C family)
MTRLLTLVLLTIVVACNSPGRQELTFTALIPGADAMEAPLDNRAFLPSSRAAPAHVPFQGTLHLKSADMNTDPATFTSRMILDRDTQLFPGVALGFFTHGDHLVPLDRNLIRAGSLRSGGSYWDIMIFPGRVWSERGDQGWSRASFGFALASHLEGESHNGVATFLYDDRQVSRVRYQITTQTSPYYVVDFFDAWGRLDATYEKAPIDKLEELKADYAAELNDRFPRASWSELEARLGADILSGFGGSGDPDKIVTQALVMDGTLYQSPCKTGYGDLPYCDVQRFGIWSVTKTAVASVAMLGLAQKYNPEVFDLRILDYLDVKPPHDGWDEVTFGDALNMATGLGEGSNVTEPNDSGDGYLVRYDAWYTAESLEEKLIALLAATNHPWGPGEVFRYRDQDMFVLGAAMHGFLKAKEGPEANLWHFLLEEIYRPIGVRHAPMGLTLEPDGSVGTPQVEDCFYPTVEDLARITTLFQNDGMYQGRQILHKEKLRELLYQTDVRGLPYGSTSRPVAGTYHMATWHRPFEASEDCTVELSYMSGWGGQKVVLLPNGLSAIRVSRAEPGDSGASDPTGMARVGHRIRPLCN